MKTVREVRVEGWDKAGYLEDGAKAPSVSHAVTRASALLSPFDSLVWCRPRIERLFAFEYRIEIYTPAPRRKYGYYVLPFLHNGRLVGRFDLKADRQASVLRVQASHIEPGEKRHVGDIARGAHSELVLMADWLGLSALDVAPRGSLARELRRSVA